jgi:EAL domain-containing protein (putative c-di-GMP-specific phosphodiesterase class I)
MMKLWQKTTKTVNKCTIRVFKFNDHMKKTLKVKSVTPNASILDGMNVLIVRNYVMDFRKEIHWQVIYEGVETLEEAQTITKW